MVIIRNKHTNNSPLDKKQNLLLSIVQESIKQLHCFHNILARKLPETKKNMDNNYHQREKIKNKSKSKALETHRSII